MTPMRTGSEPLPRAFFLCFVFAMNKSSFWRAPRPGLAGAFSVKVEPAPEWIVELGIEYNGFQYVFSVLLAQIACRSRRLMPKNHEPTFARRLGNPFLFVVERRERIQIVTHDPRIR